MAKKSHITALLLSFFLGIWGFDRFYMGHKWIGLFKMFTLGGFMFVAVVDFFRIACMDNFKNVEWV